MTREPYRNSTNGRGDRVGKRVCVLARLGVVPPRAPRTGRRAMRVGRFQRPILSRSSRGPLHAADAGVDDPAEDLRGYENVADARLAVCDFLNHDGVAAAVRYERFKFGQGVGGVFACFVHGAILANLTRVST